MDRTTTDTWVDGLSDAGYDDWRLPATPGTITGPVNEGEMGHLYYDERITYSYEGITYSSPSPFANVVVWTNRRENYL